jgi:hypothetical protein
MKKVFFIFLLCLFIFSYLNAYAVVDNRLLDMRNKIYGTSIEVRGLLQTSKDVVLLIGMFDSCLMAVSQLDAYFSMLGIMESMKRSSPNQETYKFFSEWLKGIKNTNDQNVLTLSEATRVIDPVTQAKVERLKSDFVALNGLISNELTKFYVIDKADKGKH